jgi:hypothetical protein
MRNSREKLTSKRELLRSGDKADVFKKKKQKDDI